MPRTCLIFNPSARGEKARALQAGLKKQASQCAVFLTTGPGHAQELAAKAVREGYRKSDFNAVDLFDALSFPGLWAFLKKHPAMSWAELRRSFSKRLFCEALQRLVPEIQIEDLAPGGAGVRAQAMSLDGDLVQDFCLTRRPRALHVLNAPSPAATASLAIGEEIADYVAADFKN